VTKNDLNYLNVLGVVQELLSVLKVKNDMSTMKTQKDNVPNSKEMKNNLIKIAKEKMNEITSDNIELTNYLVEIFYKQFPSYNKTVLFQLCGKQMVENVKQNCGNKISVPILDESGDLVFLNQKYRVETVEIN
jgi:hypothetical protein